VVVGPEALDFDVPGMVVDPWELIPGSLTMYLRNLVSRSWTAEALPDDAHMLKGYYLLLDCGA
jgi:hypothetical protein